MINLKVNYFSQLDNRLNPFGSCNVTSFAMVLDYYHVPRNPAYSGYSQFEDELYRFCEINNLNRHSPYDLRDLFNLYAAGKAIDYFTFKASIEQCQESIEAGNPCIFHGYFTRFGHIIVVRGFDDTGFFVNDPYGEWFSTGYRTDLSGENLHYSYDLIKRLCIDSQFWVHFFNKSGRCVGG